VAGGTIKFITIIDAAGREVDNTSLVEVSGHNIFLVKKPGQFTFTTQMTPWIEGRDKK